MGCGIVLLLFTCYKINLTEEERIANEKLLCNPDYQKEMKGEDD
jgi:hypothetical protein